MIFWIKLRIKDLLMFPTPHFSHYWMAFWCSDICMHTRYWDSSLLSMGKFEMIWQFSHWDTPSHNLSRFIYFLNKVLSLIASQLKNYDYSSIIYDNFKLWVMYIMRVKNAIIHTDLCGFQSTFPIKKISSTTLQRKSNCNIRLQCWTLKC